MLYRYCLCSFKRNKNGNVILHLRFAALVNFHHVFWYKWTNVLHHLRERKITSTDSLVEQFIRQKQSN